MNLKERAQATLDIEYPGCDSIESALEKAYQKIQDSSNQWLDIQNQIERLQDELYFVQADCQDAERAINLFTNVLNEDK